MKALITSKSISKFLIIPVRSGVLQLTLGISVVLAVLCAAMILLVYYSRLTHLQSQINIDLIDNANSGLEYLMANRTLVNYQQPATVDLFGEGIDSVTVERRPWGVYELFLSTAFRGQHRQHKTALVTAKPNEAGLEALYVAETNTPIYLVGKAEIKGIARLPERGLTTGYIDGKSFEGKQLITGKVKRSESTLPVFDTLFTKYIKAMWNNQQQEGYQVQAVDILPQGRFGFNQATLYYSDRQLLSLADSVSGNVIIQSHNKIKVTASARLNDILIIAPVIEVESGFSGRVQLFASERILVEKDCKLKYPSALILNGSNQDSLIMIREGSRVEGVVVVQGLDQNLGSGVFVIEKGGTFVGVAYVNGIADIQGTLIGHLTARRLQASVNDYPYMHHILDGKIYAADSTRHQMPASLLWNAAEHFVIAKWLNY